MLAALLTAGVASWAGIRATRDISNTLGLPGCGLVTALMVSPSLVLSMIGTGSSLASVGRYEQAVSTQVSFVMFNLCAVLPLAAALWIVRPYWQPPLDSVVSHVFTPTTAPTTAPTTSSTTAPDVESVALISTNLPYPMAVWRVDTVLLLAVAMLLLPVALGRWSLGGGEGLALLLVYAVYMVLTTAMAR